MSEMHDRLPSNFGIFQTYFGAESLLQLQVRLPGLGTRSIADYASMLTSKLSICSLGENKTQSRAFYGGTDSTKARG